MRYMLTFKGLTKRSLHLQCTKQILSEKLGRGTRTVDLEVEAKIEILKDTKKK